MMIKITGYKDTVSMTRVYRILVIEDPMNIKPIIILPEEKERLLQEIEILRANITSEIAMRRRGNKCNHY